MLTREAMLDSKTCSACHYDHYVQWSGSMHAYASDDPLFRALNKRMQRETNGALGTFCVKCHAPMAVRDGTTKDGLDLDLHPELKGITCFFCHTTTGFSDTHNNALVFASTPRMGAAIADPVAKGRSHDAAYVSALDGTQDNSAATCGSCHDIVTPGGAAIERTFAEWKESRFGVGEQTKTSCPSCHMPESDGVAAPAVGGPPRKVHDHTLAGVDLALTDFPGRDAQRAAIQTMLDDAIEAHVCVTPVAAGGATIDVSLANVKVGHAWPSGSNQDRRAWIELTASAGGATLLESGKIADEASVSDAAKADPLLFLLRDHDFDDTNTETPLFWRTVRYEAKQLPAQKTSNPASPDFDNSVHTRYPVATMPDRVEVVVHIRPIDRELIDVLVASGDLDPAAIGAIPTFTLAKTRVVWTASANAPCAP